MRTFSDWKCKCGVTTIHFDDDASVAFIGEGSDGYAKHNPIGNAITHIICRKCGDKCFVAYDVKWLHGEPKNKPKPVVQPKKGVYITGQGERVVEVDPTKFTPPAQPVKPMETVDIDFLDELPEEL